jgi:hypothetical protein
MNIKTLSTKQMAPSGCLPLVHADAD